MNKKIKILSDKAIINSKASESYISVEFDYGKEKWVGYVPIEYRRANILIDINDKITLENYLDEIYNLMDPKNMDEWQKQQNIFWETKPNASTTKQFFDVLSTGEWKCGLCDMPKNPNPQRRIQDLKDFGYTISTDLSRYCPNCKKNTSQRILLRIPRFNTDGNGYETWTEALRERIIKVLKNFDVYECKESQHCLPDHKFSEIRWDKQTKATNDENMTDDEIKQKFQLMSNQRNQQKREICRKCFQTGKRGSIYGIKYYYYGDENWDINIPQRGKEAEKGCIGCPWYDIAQWRSELLKKLKNKSH